MPTLVIGNKNYSSWSLRPWLALKQSGLPFDEVRILLDRPDSKAQIRHYSPSGRVPVYLEGDLVLWESLAICEYVAERSPVPLWPEDQGARAVARAVSAEMHSGFAALRAALPVDIRARFPQRPLDPTVQADIERIATIWQDCRRRYGERGDFLFGPFTLADAMFAPVVTRFRTYSVPVGPVSAAYSEAVLALAAMQDWVRAAEQETEVIAQA